MQKFAVALVMVLVSPHAIAGAGPAMSEDLAATLGRARFDQTVALLEACRRGPDPANAIACANLKAGIFRSQGNGPEWARVRMSLREAASVAKRAADLDPSSDVNDVDLQSIAALPPYTLNRPEGGFAIPTLGAEAATGTMWSDVTRQAYLVGMETSAGNAVAMVDTGDVTALSMFSATADKLGITRVVATVPATKSLVSTAVPEHKEELRFAEHVRIGPIELNNILVLVSPGGKDEGAIIGMGLLAKFASVSFAEDQIAFDQPTPAASKAVPFRFATTSRLGASMVLFEGDTHGRVRSIMFDTGFTSMLAFTNQLATDIANDPSTAFMPHGEESELAPHKVSQQSVSFNGINLEDIPTLLFWESPRRMPFDVILGGALKTVMDVQLNFDDGMLYFSPRSSELKQLACATPPRDASLKEDRTFCE